MLKNNLQISLISIVILVHIIMNILNILGNFSKRQTEVGPLWKVQLTYTNLGMEVCLESPYVN